MELDPVCGAGKVLGHSWPFSLHWWLSLTASDQGAWISGVGSLAAVAATVWLAFRSERRNRAERKSHELALVRIMGLKAQEALVRVVGARMAVEIVLKRIESHAVHWPVADLRMPAANDLSDLVSGISGLPNLPTDALAATVGLQVSIERYNASLDMLTKMLDDDPETPPALAEILAGPFKKVDEALDEALNVLAPHSDRIASAKAMRDRAI